MCDCCLRTGLRGCRDFGERFEIESYVAGGVEPLSGIFFEAVADNSLQAGRNVARGFGKFRDFFFQNRAHRVGGRLAVEGTLAGNHFVQDCAEGKYVGAGVGGFASHLLGGHVADGAHDKTGFGSLVAWLARRRCRAWLRGE
jgi:hypothetical protein